MSYFKRLPGSVVFVIFATKQKQRNGSRRHRTSCNKIKNMPNSNKNY